MKMKEPLKIGIIGTDTSHSTAFTELLNNRDHPFHVAGGKVVSAFAGGSDDFELSRSRVGQFASKLRDHHGVKMYLHPEQVAEEADAIMLLSADGRIHKEIFEKIAVYKKPVFIDKPFAVSYSDAQAIAAQAKEMDITIMSSSALRYAKALTDELEQNDSGIVTGADCYGPMVIEPTQRGYFWYGIHSIEMLYTLMGPGCKYVTSMRTEAPGAEEIIIGEWSNGRIGTARGSRMVGTPFAAVVHRENQHTFIDIDGGSKPFYASLLEQVMRVFKGDAPPLDMSLTLEIIRFIEAANESRETGKRIGLHM